MNLWLLCCILLFITAQGYSWLSQQTWFVMPELALPWIVLGGTGLAIASNRHIFQKPSSSSRAPTKDPVTKIPHASLQDATTHQQSPEIDQSEHSSPMQQPSSVPQPSRKKTSISFEIPKPQARSSN